MSVAVDLSALAAAIRTGGATQAYIVPNHMLPFGEAIAALSLLGLIAKSHWHRLVDFSNRLLHRLLRWNPETDPDGTDPDGAAAAIRPIPYVRTVVRGRVRLKVHTGGLRGWLIGLLTGGHRASASMANVLACANGRHDLSINGTSTDNGGASTVTGQPVMDSGNCEVGGMGAYIDTTAGARGRQFEIRTHMPLIRAGGLSVFNFFRGLRGTARPAGSPVAAGVGAVVSSLATGGIVSGRVAQASAGGRGDLIDVVMVQTKAKAVMAMFSALAIGAATGRPMSPSVRPCDLRNKLLASLLGTVGGRSPLLSPA